MKVPLALLAALAASRTVAAPVPTWRELDARSPSPFAGEKQFNSRMHHEDFMKVDERTEDSGLVLMTRALAPLDELVAVTAKSVGRAVDGIIGNSAQSTPILGSSRNVPSSATAESTEAAGQMLVCKPKKWIPLAELTEEKREHVRRIAKKAVQRYEARIKASDPAVQAQFKEQKRLSQAKFLNSLKTDDKKRERHLENKRKYGRKHYRDHVAKALSQGNKKAAQAPVLELQSSSPLEFTPLETYLAFDGRAGQVRSVLLDANPRGTAAPGRLGGSDAAEERPQFDLNLPPPGLDLNHSPA